MTQHDGALAARTNFVGSGSYCFSNSVVMALAAVGIDAHPRYVEVASGAPFGAQWEGDPDHAMPFFDPPGWNPIVGLNQFFSDHSVSVRLDHFNSFADARAALVADLELGVLPIVGPIDIGLLPYRPGAGSPVYSDHYVVVVGHDHNGVTVNDPGGHPLVPLAWSDLERIWAGETISYDPASFPLWRFGAARSAAESSSGAESMSGVTAMPTRSSALTEHLQPSIARAPERLRSSIECGAMLRLAECFRDRAADPFVGHLVWFALPLAARRWSDAAFVLSSAQARQIGVAEHMAEAAETIARQFGVLQAATVAHCHDDAATISEQIHELFGELAVALS